MKNQVIRLRKEQLSKLFPDKYTKLRMEDFVSKAVENKKILNKREFNALTNMKGVMSDREYNYSFEFYAKKKRRGIELIPF